MTTLSSTPTPTLANRMALLSGEGALDVFARAQALEREGRTIVHLELGAPDVDAPPHVVEAAIAALRAGDARYVSPQGLPELREAMPVTRATSRRRGSPSSARRSPPMRARVASMRTPIASS
jgi:aspartate aminotransferase